MTFKKIALEVIVPVTLMSRKLDKLKIVLEETSKTSIKITIVHDKRDEETGKELRELIRTINSSSISLIEGNFGSPGAARNAALKNSIADWVAFWDSDDLAQPGQFFALIEAAMAADKEFAVGQFELVQLPTETVLPKKLSKNLTQVGMNPGLWRWAFNRKHIQNIDFTEHLMGEDQLFLAACAPRSCEVYIADFVVYRYFKGVEGQLTSRFDAIKDLVEVNEHMQNKLAKANPGQIKFIFIMLIKQIATLKKYGVMGNVEIAKAFIFANRALGKQIFSTYFTISAELIK